jgi:hypothetical protein
MFGHRFHRLRFAGAKGNALPIRKHEPLMKANLIDDALGHFERPGSELTISYPDCVAVLLILVISVGDRTATCSRYRKSVVDLYRVPRRRA